MLPRGHPDLATEQEHGRCPLSSDSPPTTRVVRGSPTGTRQYAPSTQSPHGLSVSTPLLASAVVVVRAPAGGGHPEQPEARRQLAVLLSGHCTITATGETRSCGPGDVLLVEDTTGPGHSSTTSDGFTALLISLE